MTHKKKNERKKFWWIYFIDCNILVYINITVWYGRLNFQNEVYLIRLVSENSWIFPLGVLFRSLCDKMKFFLYQFFFCFYILTWENLILIPPKIVILLLICHQSRFIWMYLSTLLCCRQLRLPVNFGKRWVQVLFCIYPL